MKAAEPEVGFDLLPVSHAADIFTIASNPIVRTR